MRRPPQAAEIPLSTGIRGGDRGGAQSRPLEICDDSTAGAVWDREAYTNAEGQKRVRMTRREG